MYRNYFTILCCIWANAVMAQHNPVFQSGEAGFACFRIPAIVSAPNGDLLAFCEARLHGCSDHGNVRIVMKRSQDQGEHWGSMVTVAENGQFQAGNAAPVFDLMDKKYPGGRLFLFYNTGSDASEQEVREGKAIREIFYKTSVDNGQTWSAPVNITASVSRSKHLKRRDKADWRSYANTPGHALQLSKGKHRGRIFVAANHSEGPPQQQFRDYYAHGFYSDNHGKSWKISPNVPYPGSNESTAAEWRDGGVLMNIRNQSGDPKYRIMAYSKNAGTAWDTVFVEKQLPDPVCQGSMLNFTQQDGQELLLFSNLEQQDKRERLCLKKSADQGKNWQTVVVICQTSAAYSDLVCLPGGQVGVIYEKDGYSQIVFARVKP